MGQPRVLYAVATIVLVTAMLAARQSKPPNSVCFVDEAAKDPSLLSFREHLLGVLRARDLQALRPLIIPNIVVESGVRGIPAFEEAFELARSPDYWLAFERSLGYPGEFQAPNEFCAPYFLCRTDGKEESVTVLERNVPIMAEPHTGSTVVERVSCEVLRGCCAGLPPEPQLPPPGWTSVFFKGRWAYIEDRYVGDPNSRLVSLFIRLLKQDGKWMISFVGPAD